MNSKILFTGKFSKDKVLCRYNEVSLRLIDSAIESKTMQVWQEKVSEAKNAGKKIWDQPVYRLDKFNIKKSKCELDFSTIPFSIRISIKDFTDELFKKGEEYLPMATYSSIFIETSDGKFIFGEKSEKYATDRKHSYIGGVFNRSSNQYGEVDPFDASYKEIKEELGVNDEDIDINKFFLLGALRTESCNVALVFYCKLKITKDGVVRKFKKRKDLELNNLFFTSRRGVRDVGENKIGKEMKIVNIFELNEK